MPTTCVFCDDVMAKCDDYKKKKKKKKEEYFARARHAQPEAGWQAHIARGILRA